MSAGTNRKQYEALASLATDAGMTFTTPEGSFNQKFCDLCAQMVTYFDGTLVPATGASFYTRKASYLWQLALALGAESAGQKAPLLLNAAYTLWSTSNDGADIVGASEDYRVYAYLSHAIALQPASIEDLAQWLVGLKADGLTLDDKLDPLVVDPEPELVGVNCLEFENGASKSVKLPALTAYSLSGDSASILVNPSIGNNNQILFTVGPVFGVAPAYGVYYNNVDLTAKFRMNGDSGSPIIVSSPAGSVPLGVWTKITVGWDVSKLQISISINDGTETTATTTIDRFPTTYPTSATIGGQGDAASPTAMLSNWRFGNHTYSLAEGEGLPQDTSGNGNHATVNNATWTTADGIPSWNHSEGFYVATQGTPPFIPALADGSGLAANGLPITNPGGYVHNSSECSTVETDTDFTVFGGSNLMGNGVDTWNELSIADYLTHLNFDRGVVLQWEDTGSVCLVKERLAYPVGQTFTPVQYLQTKRWAERYTSTCGAGSLVPATVTAGTGIGPDLDWADAGDGTILFVTT